LPASCKAPPPAIFFDSFVAMAGASDQSPVQRNDLAQPKRFSP
jgi:hypothetical protein